MISTCNKLSPKAPKFKKIIVIDCFFFLIKIVLFYLDIAFANTLYDHTIWIMDREMTKKPRLELRLLHCRYTSNVNTQPDL